MLSDILRQDIKKDDKFNVCISSLANAIINPMKISFIKKEKIKSLKKHANVTITTKPTAEQRNKYFAACTLRRFANLFFITNDIEDEKLEEFNNIVTEATAQINQLLPKTLHILDADQIPQIYNLENNKSESKIKIKDKEFSISVDGSCMQGKPLHYFKMYTDVNPDTHQLKIALLTQGHEIIARSLVWIDLAKMDRRAKQNPKRFYIDRIYTKTQDHREATQFELYDKVIKYFNIETDLDKINKDLNKPSHALRYPPTYHDQRFFIHRKYENMTETKSVRLNTYPNFDVELLNYSYNYYPYLDTLRQFNTSTQTLTHDEDKGSEILVLDSTCGECSNQTYECESCGYDVGHEDDLRYVETDEMNVCEDCCVYCEERDEHILTDEAIYNNFSGTYHYRPDLDV